MMMMMMMMPIQCTPDGLLISNDTAAALQKMTIRARTPLARLEITSLNANSEVHTLVEPMRAGLYLLHSFFIS